MAIISTTILTYLATFILILLTTIFLFFKYRYTYWARNGVPYEKPSFPFGNLAESTLLKTSLGEQLTEIYSRQKENKYIGLFFFHLPFLLVIDPEMVKNIMSKSFEHFVDRGSICDEENDPLTAHLFALEGMKWKNLRQKLSPTFTSGKLKKMFQTLVDCSEELNHCLDGSISAPIDIKKFLVQYTTDVIGSCAFGIECNSFKNPDSEFIKYGIKIFNPEVFERIRVFFAFLCPRIASFLKIKVTNREVDYFFRKLVRDTIDYRETNNITRNDFMQLLIQLKNNEKLDDDDDENKVNPVGTTLTVNEASAQAFLFFVAGFETSSTTMTFCLYELAKNLQLQNRAREEIVSVLKKHDGKITYESISEMHYLERVIQETLRIHAPVMVLQRVVTQDYHIPETDTVLKKGLMIFIPAIALHMDPEFYPEPDRFDPDRFTEENKKTRPDFTYLPFGDGPRICIGLRFGMMQTKVGICRLLMNYMFTLSSKTDDPIIIDPNSFIRSVKNGIWLNAQKITS